MPGDTTSVASLDTSITASGIRTIAGNVSKFPAIVALDSTSLTISCEMIVSSALVANHAIARTVSFASEAALVAIAGLTAVSNLITISSDMTKTTACIASAISYFDGRNATNTWAISLDMSDSTTGIALFSCR